MGDVGQIPKSQSFSKRVCRILGPIRGGGKPLRTFSLSRERARRGKAFSYRYVGHQITSGTICLGYE